MKHLFLFFLMAGLLLGMTGCDLKDMEPEEMQDFLDGVVEDIGNSQITGDADLIGIRVLKDSTDAYAGAYTAECQSVTGRDVIFGGASIEDWVLLCSGKVSTESGDACVRIRLNQEVYLLPLDPEGRFETELYMHSGGNYVMIDYTDFVGTVEMTSENLNEQGSASEE